MNVNYLYSTTYTIISRKFKVWTKVVLQQEYLKMKSMTTIVFIYGLLIILGGVMGFIKGGSYASLISGGSFGIALLLSAYFISKGKSSAQYLALSLTFLLDGIFTYRFAKTLHFFPAGILSLLSLAVLIFLALKVKRQTKQV